MLNIVHLNKIKYCISFLEYIDVFTAVLLNVSFALLIGLKKDAVKHDN